MQPQPQPQPTVPTHFERRLWVYVGGLPPHAAILRPSGWRQGVEPIYSSAMRGSSSVNTACSTPAVASPSAVENCCSPPPARTSRLRLQLGQHSDGKVSRSRTAPRASPRPPAPPAQSKIAFCYAAPTRALAQPLACLFRTRPYEGYTPSKPKKEPCPRCPCGGRRILGLSFATGQSAAVHFDCEGGR